MTTLICGLLAIIAGIVIGCYLGSTAWYAGPRVNARLWRRARRRLREKRRADR